MSWRYWPILGCVVATGAVAAPFQLPPFSDVAPEPPPHLLHQEQKFEDGYLEVSVLMRWDVAGGWQAHVMPGNQPHSNRMAMPIHQVSKYLEGYVDALEATREARRPTIIYQETNP